MQLHGLHHQTNMMLFDRLVLVWNQHFCEVDSQHVNLMYRIYMFSGRFFYHSWFAPLNFVCFTIQFKNKILYFHFFFDNFNKILQV